MVGVLRPIPVVLKPSRVSPWGGQRVWIRSAEPEDADELIAFDEDTKRSDPYRVREDGEGERDDHEMRQWILEHRDTPGWLMLSVGGDPNPHPSPCLGRLLFRNGKFRKLAHHGEFGITVHHDARGIGLGTALISTLLDWARASDVIEKVCLGVFATNTRAQKLYRTLGFVEEGRYARHFRSSDATYVDDIRMAIFVKDGLAPPGYHTWRSGRPSG